MRIIDTVHARPSVCGEEPHPTRGDTVAPNTEDLKEETLKTMPKSMV
jgi:hypothetical protein